MATPIAPVGPYIYIFEIERRYGPLAPLAMLMVIRVHMYVFITKVMAIFMISSSRGGQNVVLDHYVDHYELISIERTSLYNNST